MSTPMLTAHWTINVEFDEDPDYTIAHAVLNTPSGTEVRGTGRARRNPSDRPVARIGEEVACARALSQLSRALTDLCAEEIEVNVRRGDPVP